MRIIAAVRLSRMTDATTSPERQAESMREYAQRNGHTIIAETSDLDVSGGKAIRKRPGVGAWLTPEHLDEWDAIAGYAIDRMFRDMYDFVTFWHDFLEPNGKKLVITSESIDMSTPEGMQFAQWRVMMAESELAKIRKRNKDAADWTRKAGLWKGGQVPWGYRPVPAEHNGRPHWKLEPDPDTAGLVNRIAGEIIAGKTVAQVARELTEQGIPTGRKGSDGKPRTNWRPGPLIRLLRMETLKGYVPYDHQLVKRGGRKVTVYQFVRNPDGSLMRRQPVLDDDTWTDLQEALKRPAQAARGKRHDASPLLHIAKCAACGAWMHHNAFTSRGTRYRYYTCNRQGTPGCQEKSVNAEALETWVDLWFTRDGAFAGQEITEYRVVPGTDWKAEIADIDLQISSLDQDAPDYDELHARLRGERKRLLALPVKAPEYREQPTGITVRDYWLTLTPERKRDYLLRAEVTIPVRNNPGPGDPLDVWLEGHPEKVRGVLGHRRAA